MKSSIEVDLEGVRTNYNILDYIKLVCSTYRLLFRVFPFLECFFFLLFTFLRHGDNKEKLS